MHVMRESWTDERLDDLNGKVDRGFADTKDEFAKVRTEMRDEFAKARAETKDVRAEMREEFVAVRAEIAGLRSDMQAGFNSLQRTMIQFSGVIVAALIGLLATQL
jgi:hypothetical protein